MYPLSELVSEDQINVTVELLYVGLLYVGQFALERRNLLLYVLCVRPTPLCGTLLYMGQSGIDRLSSGSKRKASTGLGAEHRIG